jgi:ABC-type nitrate/sulfonate/bicarbonate transport system ATPase subunit
MSEYRHRISKHYEIRLGYSLRDKNGDIEDRELTDMIEISGIKKYTLSDLLENLEKDQYLELEISERYYERYSTDDEWEFIDDDLHAWYSEGEGFSEVSLPKYIIKQLDSWKNKQTKEGE